MNKLSIGGLSNDVRNFIMFRNTDREGGDSLSANMESAMSHDAIRSTDIRNYMHCRSSVQVMEDCGKKL